MKTDYFNTYIANCYSKSHHGILFNQMGLTNIGVELGTFEGLQAWFILNRWAGKKLYTIDAYSQQDVTINKDYDPDMNRDEKGQTEAYNIAFNRLKPFGDRVEMIRAFTHDASFFFKDDSLDFVYVDANHTYDAVIQDMTDWYSKIKLGGLLLGDDYDSPNHQDVIDAVNDWTDNMKIPYCNGPYGEPMGAHNQWYIIK